MWQEHLSTLANDPAARAELTRFLEPQRRMFADWAAMMQGGNRESKSAETHAAGSHAQHPSSASQASGGAAHGDDALRIAQLALRVAELEKRIARLESKPARASRRAERPAS